MTYGKGFIGLAFIAAVAVPAWHLSVEHAAEKRVQKELSDVLLSVRAAPGQESLLKETVPSACERVGGIASELTQRFRDDSRNGAIRLQARMHNPESCPQNIAPAVQGASLVLKGSY